MSIVTRCIFVATSAGTGNFVVASAFAGYLTPAQANAVGGAVYEYAAQTVDGSGNVTAWEVGNGVYTSGTVTLARTNILYSSNSNNVVNFAAAPNVYLTAITLNNLTITTNNPIFDLTQTWNAAGVVFTGLKFNFTNTASAAGSKIFDFQVGGASCFNYDVTAGVLSLFKSTTAQTFRVYNSFTDASNYERGILDWTTTANTLTIGTQAAGSGTQRGVQFVAASSFPFFFYFDGNLGSTSFWYMGNNGQWHGRNSGFEALAFDLNNGGGVQLSSVSGILFNNASSILSGSVDAALKRAAAGVVELNNGTAGTLTGTYFHWGGQARVSGSDFNTGNSTSLADITGLTASVAAGRTYSFEAILYTTSDVAAGVKFAIAGTATATAIVYEALVDNAAAISAQTRAAALATTVGAVTAVTAAYARITGTITVNAAGTLTVQMAQNVGNATGSKALIGSSFLVYDMP